MTVKALRKLLHGLSPEAEVRFRVERKDAYGYTDAKLLGARHGNKIEPDRSTVPLVVITLRCKEER